MRAALLILLPLALSGCSIPGGEGELVIMLEGDGLSDVRSLTLDVPSVTFGPEGDKDGITLSPTEFEVVLTFRGGDDYTVVGVPGGTYDGVTLHSRPSTAIDRTGRSVEVPSTVLTIDEEVRIRDGRTTVLRAALAAKLEGGRYVVSLT